ncbi:MAG: DNA repair protein RecO [Pseudobdellovibrionaceae bacterium]
MESWRDQALVLSSRRHGEAGAVITLLSETNGRHAGYLHGATSNTKKIFSEPGTEVTAEWQARTSDQLGHFRFEYVTNWAGFVMEDRARLTALTSACQLVEQALPEREAHPEIFYGLKALFQTLQTDVWGAAYVMWEIAFLKELGFAIDLTKCAGGGDAQTLAYVSPKTGRAVSSAQGLLYKDRLLHLPEFLKKDGDRQVAGSDEDVATGLKMTGHFWEHWVFAQHSGGIPEARLRLAAQFVKKDGNGKV